MQVLVVVPIIKLYLVGDAPQDKPIDCIAKLLHHKDVTWTAVYIKNVKLYIAGNTSYDVGTSQYLNKILKKFKLLIDTKDRLAFYFIIEALFLADIKISYSDRRCAFRRRYF